MPTYTHLGDNWTDTDGTVYLTDSITWPSDAEVGLLCGATRETNNPTTPTISGGWSNWSVQSTRASGTVAGSWVAIGYGTKTNGQITVNYGADSQLCFLWSCGSLKDVPDVIADIIDLVSTGGTTGVQTHTATLAGTATSGSLIMCWFMANAGSSFNADSGWTEHAEPGTTNPIIQAVLVSNTTLDQSYVGTWVGSTGCGWIIFEVEHAATPTGSVVRTYNGSTWVTVSGKRTYNGTSWVNVSEAREI